MFPVLLMMMLSAGNPWNVCGQKKSGSDAVLDIFNKYEEKEGVESITVSPALLGLMKNGKDGDRKTQELISKISGLRIITINDGNTEKGKITRESFVNELQAIVKKEYTEIMKVKTSEEKVELYIREAENCKDCKAVSALLFINSVNSSVTAMHLAGTIDKTLIDAVMNGDISIFE
jgi:hypothetical protein